MTCNNKCIHYPVCEQKNYDFANIEECPYYYVAPTVELKDIYQEGYYDGHLEGYTKAINEEKPQGEWIAREDMDYLDKNEVVHNHFECNKCGLIHDFLDGHTAQYNFCPNCGARMQTKENLNG